MAITTYTLNLSLVKMLFIAYLWFIVCLRFAQNSKLESKGGVTSC